MISVFYRIEPVRIRFIGGFGKIHWVEPAQYLLPTSALAAQEGDILQHMNQDHVESLKAYCRHVHGVETQHALMVGIDPDGFDVRCDEQVMRFEFLNRCWTQRRRGKLWWHWRRQRGDDHFGAASRRSSSHRRKQPDWPDLLVGSLGAMACAVASGGLLVGPESHAIAVATVWHPAWQGLIPIVGRPC